MFLQFDLATPLDFPEQKWRGPVMPRAQTDETNEMGDDDTFLISQDSGMSQEGFILSFFYIAYRYIRHTCAQSGEGVFYPGRPS